MAVYVDNYRAKYGRMRMSHMVADTSEELLDMARQIGVNEKWLQKAGTPEEHFDICESKVLLAMKNGAIEVTPQEIVERIKRKRKFAETTKPNKENKHEKNA